MLRVDAIEAELFPDDKPCKISAFRKRHRKVVFIGGGTEAAPSLAVADIGIVLGDHLKNGHRRSPENRPTEEQVQDKSSYSSSVGAMQLLFCGTCFAERGKRCKVSIPVRRIRQCRDATGAPR